MERQRESSISPKNFIVVQGWMLTELELKGNELIIYAVIYGFSQACGQLFDGSWQYLADWTNSTKESVRKCLKSLIDKGYITKIENFVNGVKFCSYYATKLSDTQQSCVGVANKVGGGSQQSCVGVANKVGGGSQQSCYNNIEDNISEKIEEKYIFGETANPGAASGSEPVHEIIAYLNQKAGTSYRLKAKSTQRHIHARMQEGFTLDDFKTVIDKKCAEWCGTQFEKYLRPETLFGTKFESYLNEKINPGSAGRPQGFNSQPPVSAGDYDW